MTAPAVRTAQLLYDALARADVRAIGSLLHAEFRGSVAAGMPHRVGGIHEGPDSMLRDCWAVIFAHYEIAPRPAEIVELPDGRLVALGQYVGIERATRRAVNATFAHVLRLRDGLIVELHQITDTASW